MIELEDCFADSPQFQLEMQSIESALRQLEAVLKNLCKATKHSSECMQALSLANDAMARTLVELGSVEATLGSDADNDQVSTTMLAVASELAAIEDKRRDAALEIERIVIVPLEMLVKGDLATLRELRKRYERSGYEYVHNSTKYMAKKGSSKEDNVIESAHIVAESRREFHECSLDYVLKVKEIWKKQLFILESSVSQVVQKLSAQAQEECEAFERLRIPIEELHDMANNHRDQFDSECLIAYDQKSKILKQSLGLYNPMMIEKSSTPLSSMSTIDEVSKKKGYLYKKSSHSMRPLWSRRFFEIKDDKLRYWRADASEVICIDLKLCAVKPSECSERRYCFDVISPVRTFTLQAESERDLQEWINAVNQSIKKGLSGSSVDLVNEAFSTDRPLTELERRKIQSVGGNDRCIDCPKPHPDWACINYGTLVCIDCSGLHRNRGVHKSKVKSLELDHFTNEQIVLLFSLGNDKVAQLFPQTWDGLDQKYTAECDDTIDVAKAIRENDVLSILLVLMNGKECASDCLLMAIECAQTTIVSLLLLWSAQVTFEHLKQMLINFEGNSHEKLAFQLLKRVSHLNDEEKAELQVLGKARHMYFFNELLSYMIDEDECDDATLVTEEEGVGSEKEVSSVRRIKETIKHQLGKFYKQ